MTSNMSLEDILQCLAKYGRPTVNQFSVSATPGSKAAGKWSVEVWIPSKWDLTAPENVSVTGRRMIGQGELREAAEMCLQECITLFESDLSSWYKFVSEEDIRAIEKDRSNNA